MRAAPKTPLGNWPGGANPKSLKEFAANLKEARKRWAACIASRDSEWAEVMKLSSTGFLQEVVDHRDKAEEQGQFALRLEKQIREWESQELNFNE